MTGSAHDRAAAIDRALLRWVEHYGGRTTVLTGTLDPGSLDVGDGPAVTDVEVDRRWTYLEALQLVKFRPTRQNPRLRVTLTADGVRCLAECDGDVRTWNARHSPGVNQPITVFSQGGDVQVQVDSPGAAQHQRRR
ncbi:hypothetical protein ADK67_04810 [Saccharothrix sp. NRRL B-16348]|uniref:hypothetical protein n=1 Tax=Saccharothrix sp. NRRL B-16348 TaxID=1415542 RepID=UPI0006ADF31D|nr:hypothetical protein [Saccharothrix sp. NRRL B-16348]KOX33973.1 hypothetical protein ADK67_04810 [Saccharothrix sp. NRRL B-16348]